MRPIAGAAAATRLLTPNARGTLLRARGTGPVERRVTAALSGFLGVSEQAASPLLDRLAARYDLDDLRSAVGAAGARQPPVLRTHAPKVKMEHYDLGRATVNFPRDTRYADREAAYLDYVLAPYVEDKGRWADAALLAQFARVDDPDVNAVEASYARWAASPSRSLAQRFLEHAVNVVYAYRRDTPPFWPFVGDPHDKPTGKVYAEGMSARLKDYFGDASPPYVFEVLGPGDDRRGASPCARADEGYARSQFWTRTFVGEANNTERYSDIRMTKPDLTGGFASDELAGAARHRRSDGALIELCPGELLSAAVTFDFIVDIACKAMAYAFGASGTRHIGPSGRMGGAAVDADLPAGAPELSFAEALTLLRGARQLGAGALGILAAYAEVLHHELVHAFYGVGHCDASCAPNGLAAYWSTRVACRWGAYFAKISVGSDAPDPFTGDFSVDGLVDFRGKVCGWMSSSVCARLEEGEPQRRGHLFRLQSRFHTYGVPADRDDFDLVCLQFTEGDACLKRPDGFVPPGPCVAADELCDSEPS